MHSVSIIIPVYNAKDYLFQCLDSILSQTYYNWECLLVDDGSVDGSASVCDDYSVKDGRFRVFHQKNSGVSVARNNGIENADGDYICFMDADDWIENDFLSSLLSQSPHDLDWILSGQARDFQDGHSITLVPEATVTFSIDSKNAVFFLELERKLLLFAPHEKLYKRSIIQAHDIRFPENCSYGEDLIFNFRYLEHVNAISTVAVAKYHYRIHEGTLTFAFRPGRFEEDYSQWRILRDFHERRGLWNDEVEAYLAQRLWGIVYDGLFLYPKLEDNQRGYISRVLSIPEILLLKRYEDGFKCAKWIKFAIVHRMSVVFRTFFTLFG